MDSDEKPKSDFSVSIFYNKENKKFTKSRSRDIDFSNYLMALRFDRHRGSPAVTPLPVKCQSDTTIQTSNLTAPRRHEILR